MSALPRGDVRRSHVLSIAWPVLVSMMSMTVMNLADAVFAGWAGTVELAAVGLASTLGFFLLTPARGLIRAVKILTSHAAGADDRSRVRSWLAQGVWLSAVLGTLLGSLAMAGSWLFAVLGTSETVAGHASDYLWVMMLTAPVYTLVWTLEGWFQGQGDTRTPMRATLVANGLNIGLDPWFIFGGAGLPALGVGGAALATAVATVLQLVLLLVQVRQPLSRLASWPRRDRLAEIVRFGMPLSVQWTLDFGGFMVLIALLARAGDAELAAHVLVFRLVMMSMLPGFSVADAAGVLVGQAIGARRPEAASQAWRVSIQLAAGLMGAFGVAFLAVPELLIWPFQPAADVAIVAVPLLGLASLWQLADGVLMCNLQSLMAAGDTRFTMFAAVGASWVIQVPISTLLVLHLEWGAFGGWVGITAEVLALTVISTVRVLNTSWADHGTAVPAEVPVEA